MAIKSGRGEQALSAAGEPGHPQHDHEALAAVFRAVAEPHRLQIVHSLAAGERRVADLVAESDVAQSTLSAHLGVLRAAGLVQVRSHGRASYYSLRSEEHTSELQSRGHLLC